MTVNVPLLALPEMHPRLLWNEIMAAKLIVFRGPGRKYPFQFDMEVKNVPGFADEHFAWQSIQRVSTWRQPSVCVAPMTQRGCWNCRPLQSPAMGYTMQEEHEFQRAAGAISRGECAGKAGRIEPWDLHT
jgi:hypothetical protein